MLMEIGLVALVLLAAGAMLLVLDRLMAMARRQGRPFGERFALLALALLAGPLGWLLVWWMLSRRPAPSQAASTT